MPTHTNMAVHTLNPFLVFIQTACFSITRHCVYKKQIIRNNWDRILGPVFIYKYVCRTIRTRTYMSKQTVYHWVYVGT